jgi:hypothetical protein
MLHVRIRKCVSHNSDLALAPLCVYHNYKPSHQCCGSVTFWYGSRSADSCLVTNGSDPGGPKSYEPESGSATLLPTKLQQDSYFVYKDTKVHHCRKYGEILPYYNNILATVPLVEGKTRFQSSKFKGKKSYFSGLKTRCPCHYLIVTVQAKIEEY